MPRNKLLMLSYIEFFVRWPDRPFLVTLVLSWWSATSFLYHKCTFYARARGSGVEDDDV